MSARNPEQRASRRTRAVSLISWGAGYEGLARQMETAAGGQRVLQVLRQEGRDISLVAKGAGCSELSPGLRYLQGTYRYLNTIRRCWYDGQSRPKR